MARKQRRVTCPRCRTIYAGNTQAVECRCDVIWYPETSKRLGLKPGERVTFDGLDRVVAVREEAEG